MKKLNRLEEKIFLATYSKARYLEEISDLIYGDSAQSAKQLIPVIKSLETRGIIQRLTPQFDYPTKKRPGFSNGFYLSGSAEDPRMAIVLDEGKRAARRKYVLANSDFLLAKIIDILKKKEVLLSEEEQKKLREYLYKGFRQAVSTLDFFNKGEQEGLEFLYLLLASECTFSILQAQYREMLYQNLVQDKNGYSDWLAENYNPLIFRTMFYSGSIELEHATDLNTLLDEEWEEPFIALGLELSEKLMELAPVEAMLSKKNCLDIGKVIMREFFQITRFNDERRKKPSNSQATSF
jgi:hypothetical protein